VEIVLNTWDYKTGVAKNWHNFNVVIDENLIFFDYTYIHTYDILIDENLSLVVGHVLSKFH
jgi:hypothetical protein